MARPNARQRRKRRQQLAAQNNTPPVQFQAHADPGALRTAQKDERIIAEESQTVHSLPFTNTPGSVANPNISLGESAELNTQADFARQYVAGRFWGLLSFLSTLPHAFDDLTKEFGTEVYARMANDSEVTAGLELMVMASTSAETRFVPNLAVDHPDYPRAQYVAQFFQSMIGELDKPFYEIRQEMVREALLYGSAAGELQFEVIKRGDYAGLYGLCSIRPTCICDTAYVVDNFNRVVGVIPTKVPGNHMPIGSYVPLQVDPETGEFKVNEGMIERILPRSKFWLLNWKSKCGDPRGSSALRPAYTAWWAKQQIVHLMLEWFGKYSQPSIWGTVPEDAAPICYTDAAGNEVEIQPTEKLLETLMSFRNSSAMALPHGTEINTLDMSQGGDIFLKAINWANKEITRALLMQHMATTDSEHMARSSSETHQDVLSLLVASMRRWQAQSIQRNIIRPLTQANFGQENMHLAPKIDLGDGDGFPITPHEVSQLQNSGWFTFDQMPHIDKLLGLPVRQTQDISNGANNPPVGADSGTPTSPAE